MRSPIHLSEALRTALVERHFSRTNAGFAVDLVLPLAADSRRTVEVLPGALRSANPDEWFARKLQTVLAGVEQELAPVQVC
ncbi:hypothetical protein [Aestuariimicrobium sp. Y1814]|uniref:hypothetical protein n=1 Tax=Aestuariimicrobium sp. Y1814 TaxID=3418742 RepID=UPI003DA75F39